MNPELQPKHEKPARVLAAALCLVRWITVPLFFLVGVIGVLTQDSFQWTTGPYGGVFVAWLICYGIWAGFTSAARAIDAAEIDFAAKRDVVIRNVREEIGAGRAHPQARFEFLVAMIAFAVGLSLPETGFQILGLTFLHMLFVFTWRYFAGARMAQS